LLPPSLVLPHIPVLTCAPPTEIHSLSLHDALPIWNYRYAGGGDVSANFPFRRCDEWNGITLACCSTPALVYYRLLKMRFSCSCTRINVVRLVSSFRREAPTYVQAERRPPKISRAVFSTGPRSGSLTVLPSAARYSATQPT